jgi:hypothetical protein
MDNEHFPHAALGGDVPELYLMDVFPLNYHINFQKWDWLRNFIDIRSACRLEDDFLGSPTTDWAVTKTGAGTNVIAGTPNGALLITNAAADNDKVQYLSPAAYFYMEKGFPLYLEGKFQIFDPVQTDWFFGLVDAEYLGGSCGSGAYFYKADGSASIFAAVEDATVVVPVDTGVDFVSTEWLHFGLHWDGDTTLRWFIFTDAGLVAATGVFTTGFPLSSGLYLGFGLMNGEAVAKTLYVDYVKCVSKRYVA